MFCTEDIWKATDQWWEGGPEPKECEGCDGQVEDELADDSEFCLEFLEIAEHVG